MLTLNEAKRLHKEYDAIPLTITLPSDLETPLSCYLKWGANYPINFLFESVEGGESIARYSFIGADPREEWSFLPDEIIHTSTMSESKFQETPQHVIEKTLDIGRVYQPDGLPSFLGGLVGYFGYETAGWTEQLPRFENPLGWPDAWLGRFGKLIIFDHRHQLMTLVSLIVHPRMKNGKRNTGFDAAYERGSSELSLMAKSLIRPLPASAKAVAMQPGISASIHKSKADIIEDCDKATFSKRIYKAKRHIRDGDIFQVVLSRSWSICSSRSPVDVYRSLRRQNPSPYLFLLNMRSRSIVGSSPEMLLRSTDRHLETRPIAGTRPRGKTPAQDAAFEASLIVDPKELAEHTMLVDLGRNDLGRVAEPGSIRIPDQLIVEKYARVMHLVSSVTGKLRKGKTCMDAHQAVFPAGTVSGAPKIRAMQLIAELEQNGRGVYAGSIGYLDYHGNMDTCIGIRMACYENGNYFVRAGAGIVADSIASREFDETSHKAASMIRAITEEELC